METITIQGNIVTLTTTSTRTMTVEQYKTYAAANLANIQKNQSLNQSMQKNLTANLATIQSSLQDNENSN